MKKLILRLIVALIVTVVPNQVCAEVECFCRSTLDTSNFETTANTSWNHALPICGQGQMPKDWFNETGYKVNVYPQVRYWNFGLTPPRWSPMSNWTQYLFPAVRDWYVDLPVCPADLYEPIEGPPDCNEDDMDEDEIPDLCDPWPNQSNVGDQFVRWASYNEGGQGYRPANGDGDGFCIGGCGGAIATLLIGESPDYLVNIMNEACDCNSPPGISIVPESSDEIPLPTPPDPNDPLPPIPPDLSDGGGESGGADSDPQAPSPAIPPDLPDDGGDSGNATSDPRIPVRPDPPTPPLSPDGGESGDADADPLPDSESLDLSSIEANTAATAKNTRQLVIGQNDVRDYLSAIQRNTIYNALGQAVTANNTALLVEGQNDVRDYLDALQQSNLSTANNTAVIAGNTASLVDGQNQANESLESIQSSAAIIADRVDGVADGIDGVADGVDDLVGRADNIVGLLQDQASAIVQEGIDSENAASDALGELGGAIADGNYTGYGQGDVPDTEAAKTEYETAVQGVKDSSGVSSAAGQVGVSCSGAQTSMTVNVWGSDIVFDFGKWETFYNLVGIAFLSLCYLLGFFLILRG